MCHSGNYFWNKTLFKWTELCWGDLTDMRRKKKMVILIFKFWLTRFNTLKKSQTISVLIKIRRNLEHDIHLVWFSFQVLQFYPSRQQAHTNRTLPVVSINMKIYTNWGFCLLAYMTFQQCKQKQTKREASPLFSHSHRVLEIKYLWDLCILCCSAQS